MLTAITSQVAFVRRALLDHFDVELTDAVRDVVLEHARDDAHGRLLTNLAVEPLADLTRAVRAGLPVSVQPMAAGLRRFIVVDQVQYPTALDANWVVFLVPILAAR